METNGPTSRQRRQSSADRFLTLLSQSPPSSAGDELSEDDVFWNGESVDSSGPLPSSSSFTYIAPPGPRDQHSTAKAFARAENFGILAALPEMGHERNSRRSVFNHKNSSATPASSSALSSASASRMIPVIPRPPPERTFSASLKYQSAPMNVPMMMRNDFDRLRKGRLLEENEDLEEDGEEGAMRPPHEIVAMQSGMSPVLSSSVLEGAGRTLKGRDLRQVRNAVFRQTGFLD